VLWHIVRFRFPADVDPAARADLEARLAGLDDPQVTGLLTGFADEAALAVYRDHPEHVPVVARARELCEDIVRLDVVTDDPPDALPRTI